MCGCVVIRTDVILVDNGYLCPVEVGDEDTQRLSHHIRPWMQVDGKLFSDIQIMHTGLDVRNIHRIAHRLNMHANPIVIRSEYSQSTIIDHLTCCWNNNNNNNNNNIM